MNYKPFTRFKGGTAKRPSEVCPKCGAMARITKTGYWYKHHQPPSNDTPYGITPRVGPVCINAGRYAGK